MQPTVDKRRKAVQAFDPGIETRLEGVKAYLITVDDGVEAVRHHDHSSPLERRTDNVLEHLHGCAYQRQKEEHGTRVVHPIKREG